MEQDLFTQKLQLGERDFLKTLDFDQLNLGEVDRLGDGAAYYLSFIFKELKNKALAEKMLRREWEKGRGIWKEEAGKELVSFYIKAENYRQSEQLAKAFLERYPDQRAIRISLAESLYWQKKNSEARAILKELIKKERFGYDQMRTLSLEERELFLFRLVVDYRLDLEGWQAELENLFAGQPATYLHVRAYDYLLEQGALEAHFTREQRELFNLKTLVAKKQFQQALSILDGFMKDQGFLTRELKAPDKSLFLSPWNIEDYGRIYAGLNLYRQGAERLFELSLKLYGESRFAAFMAAGRLFRLGGNHRQAARSFKYAYDSLLVPEVAKGYGDQDRVLWFYMESVAEDSPRAAVSRFSWLIRKWHDPHYFSDLINSLVAILVEKREWKLLRQLFTELDGRAAEGDLARMAFILALNIKEGAGGEASEAERDARIESANRLFRRAIQGEAHPYYQTMGRFFLGLPQIVVESSGSEEDGQAERDEAAVAGSRETERFLEGFLRFGLFDRGYRWAQRKSAALSSNFIKGLSEAFISRDHYLYGINLARWAFYRHPADSSRQDFLRLYPLLYWRSIQSVATEEGINPYLFTALVREESHFESRIVSRAGAVGLTQLMPRTAKEVADSLGLKEPSLEDPEENLRIGARYLAKLKERFGVSFALLAYNAGPSRVRRWQASHTGLSGLLFLEAVPFEETRGYVKKILVSAVVYGYLYGRIAAEKTIRLFFPNL